MSSKPKLSECEKLSKKEIEQAVQLVVEGIKPYNKSALLKNAKLRSISNKKSRFILIQENDSLIGFLMFRVEKNLCYIYEIHVSKERRNKGLGQLMMDRLFQAMKNFIFILFVHKNNEKAASFYLRNNFELDREYESEAHNMMSRVNN